ncbi:serine/threonine-protein kinase [Actinoalloteichus hoggarensis]|uniref:serine/threonine-protein kinase n=1 Tax=Actinoalloteichus hoggarensis TaxID=1470176 RepID=UPI0035DC440F
MPVPPGRPGPPPGTVSTAFPVGPPPHPPHATARSTSQPRQGPPGPAAQPATSGLGPDRTVVTSPPGRAAFAAGSGASSNDPTSSTSVRGDRPTGTNSTSSRTGSARSRRGSTRSSRRGRLGGGLVEVPQVTARDPASVVLSDPQVAENKRYCASCQKPVGRSRGGRPGRVDGYCPNCGARYSFSPKLGPGDVLAGQYEVLGCIAHGGFGWIYLARDRNVHDRWVVLKGLLNDGDADAVEATLNEQRALAEVEHPNVVRIFNVVQPADASAAETVGYIVMEYVGGQSLRDILTERRKTEGPTAALPLDQAIAYVLEILPAMGYLHERGLLYCDLKPDNVIQTTEQIKLIDMGAVLHVDDDYGAVYGTIGYQAPEIATIGPSISSDLYTVGRLLAVLSFHFPGYNKEFKEQLPDPADVPVLAEHESLLRFLRRACHTDPNRRFDSADEMAEQLTGVLREVVAVRDRKPVPGVSPMFTPERRSFGVDDLQKIVSGTAVLETRRVAMALPVPMVDPTDPAAGFLLSAEDAGPEQLRAAAQTNEVRLRLARAHIDRGELRLAWQVLQELARQDPDDWRIAWYLALGALAAGDLNDARNRFEALYDRFPGEQATRLAVAVTDEFRGDVAAAARRYDVVWRTDHDFVSAAFGLARARLRTGDVRGAVLVLESVPDTSRHHVAARIAAILARVQGRSPSELGHQDLLDAASRLEPLGLDAERRARLTVEVLRAAHEWVRGVGAGVGGRPKAPGRVFGYELDEHILRLGLERGYRSLARAVDDRAERIALVDRANSLRPRTLV